MSAIPVLMEPFRIVDTSTLTIIGDAPKDFVVLTSGTRYIAKQPRKEGPIECVTEHLIGRIGRLLPLRVAEGRLVRLRSERDVRFMSRFFLGPREQLLHGSQIIAACFELQERELQTEIPRGKEWSFYTYDLVVNAFDHLWNKHKKSLTDGFARMMAFDALVGANDRHPQNWGVVLNVVDREAPPRFSPIFDTARGLFWNEPDDRLETVDRERRRSQKIASYANGSERNVSTGVRHRGWEFRERFEESGPGIAH